MTKFKGWRTDQRLPGVSEVGRSASDWRPSQGSLGERGMLCACRLFLAAAVQSAFILRRLFFKVFIEWIKEGMLMG